MKEAEPLSTPPKTWRFQFGLRRIFLATAISCVFRALWPWFMPNSFLHHRLQYAAFVLYFVSLAAISLWYLFIKKSRHWVLVLIAVLSLLDAVIFLTATLPSFFGYMGTEDSMWTSLAVAVISGATGLFALGPLFLLFYILERRTSAKNASGVRP